MWSAVDTRVSPGYMRISNFDIEMAKYYMCFSIKRIICCHVIIYVRLVSGVWAGPWAWASQFRASGVGSGLAPERCQDCSALDKDANIIKGLRGDPTRGSPRRLFQ